MKPTPESGWNVLFVASLLATVLTIGYAAAVPVPSVPETHKAVRSSISTLNATSANLEKATAEASVALTEMTWDVSAEALGSLALNRVNQLADQNHLLLSGFRTEQTLNVAHLGEAPMVVTVEGSYVNAIAFLKSFEAADSKITVNLFQVTASDQGVDHVTATLGVLGFLTKEAK